MLSASIRAPDGLSHPHHIVIKIHDIVLTIQLKKDTWHRWNSTGKHTFHLSQLIRYARACFAYEKFSKARSTANKNFDGYNIISQILLSLRPCLQ
jgi:hypothetical protein